MACAYINVTGRSCGTIPISSGKSPFDVGLNKQWEKREQPPGKTRKKCSVVYRMSLSQNCELAPLGDIQDFPCKTPDKIVN